MSDWTFLLSFLPKGGFQTPTAAQGLMTEIGQMGARKLSAPSAMAGEPHEGNHHPSPTRGWTCPPTPFNKLQTYQGTCKISRDFREGGWGGVQEEGGLRDPVKREASPETQNRFQRRKGRIEELEREKEWCHEGNDVGDKQELHREQERGRGKTREERKKRKGQEAPSPKSFPVLTGLCQHNYSNYAMRGRSCHVCRAALLSAPWPA